MDGIFQGKPGGCTDGSIYELQGLSELHYYLKVEHVFTPAEVEALLSFQDPLDVARWCWEENNHEHSFPICDLLKEIDAAQKFEHFTSEPSAQDKYTLLMKRLGQNYFAYRESLMSRDKESLIEKDVYKRQVKRSAVRKKTCGKTAGCMRMIWKP